MQPYRMFVAFVMRLFTAIAAIMVAHPSFAQSNHISAQLVIESGAAPGKTIMLALHMRPEAGWHGYWQNPGDAGLPMILKWQLPKRWSAGDPLYPVPQTLLVKGLMNHVYEREYAVLVPLKIPADAVSGAEVNITVAADWLACSDTICVPEKADLAAKVLLGAANQPVLSDTRFDSWRLALPAPLGAMAKFTVTAKSIRIGIPLPQTVHLDQPHFFFASENAADYAAEQQFSRAGDLFIVEVPRAKFAPLEPSTLSGVLRLRKDGSDGLAIAAKLGPVPAGGDDIAGASKQNYPMLILAALAGGLLLNIMPCVFPILSLKALSLARAGGDETAARREGLAYSAGVVLACVVLGALLLALRAAGQQVGWAFQLQEPWVVALLLVLALAITANLSGLFEFAVPGFIGGMAGGGSPQSSFATGLLAAFVATPCTGPFMAAAMGAALLLPVPQAMLLFVALGVGLALPFLAIALIPAMRKLLPRPGAWMNWFRKAMAVPMGLTAMALVWLLAKQLGSMGMILALVFSIGILAALMAVGMCQKAGRSARLPALAATVLALAVPVAITFQAKSGVPGTLVAAHYDKVFSERALAKARASGKPVFVYFTADWCLTCKVNEQVAISRDATLAAFAKEGVVVLVGDWTRRDAAITRFLTQQGAAGVPLYLWYTPGKDQPEQLPQILSPELLIGQIRKASAPPRPAGAA